MRNLDNLKKLVKPMINLGKQQDIEKGEQSQSHVSQKEIFSNEDDAPMRIFGRKRRKRNTNYNRLLRVQDLYTRAQSNFKEGNYKSAENQCRQAYNLIRRRKLDVSKYIFIFYLQDRVGEILIYGQEVSGPSNLGGKGDYNLSTTYRK